MQIFIQGKIHSVLCKTKGKADDESFFLNILVWVYK